MYYVYIIYSEAFARFYVGASQDPWLRFEKHNTSKFNTYTSKYRPWVLKAVFLAGTTRSDAEQIEKFIKKQKSKTLILKMIDPSFVLSGKLAQLVRVPHVRD
jgi:putative endonuclease